MFENLQLKDTIEHDGDFVGGGSRVLETDVYPLTIDMAYMDVSTGGAMSFNITLKGKNKEVLRETMYITSGTAKGCKNTYVNKKTQQEHYLPGFSQANNLCLLAIGKNISELVPEDKVLSLYDHTAKKEMPQTKKVLTALLGAAISVAVEKQIVDKTAKSGEQDSFGNDIYVATGETREQNEIIKTFQAVTNLTAAEIRAKITEPTFMTKWIELNKGNVKDKSTGIPANVGAVGIPSGAAAATPAGQTVSLF